MDAANRLPVQAAFGRGWATLLLFVVVAIPLIITSAFIATALSDWTGGDITKSLSVIVWIPVVLSLTGAVLGRKTSPAAAGAGGPCCRSPPRGSGSSASLSSSPSPAPTPSPPPACPANDGAAQPDEPAPVAPHHAHRADGIAVAAPLSATATMAAVGTVGVATLVSAGVPATTAAVAVLVSSSCEAAVPPGGAPLYVACGIADVDPIKTFTRLLTHYALPCSGIGVLSSSSASCDMKEPRHAQDRGAGHEEVVFVLSLAALIGDEES